jgi:hypothetical protein
MSSTTYRDALGRFAQLGQSGGVQLVKITSHVSGNQYEGSVLTLDADGNVDAAPDTVAIDVVNLAEAEDSDGQIGSNTPAVAVDVEGRWVVYIQPTPGRAFVGELVSTSGTGLYTVRPQAPTGQSAPTAPVGFENNGATLEATNLSEVGTSSASLDTGLKVLIHAVPTSDNPPLFYYVFDHPAEEAPA